MDRLRKISLLTKLIKKLYDNNSWCGETHIQKATYLLQELTKVPLGYDFILYKHGPFSFGLRDELTALRADNLIVIEPQSPPYGPRINITKRSEYIQGKYSITLNKYANNIDFVADRLKSKGVAELERLATAFLVTKDMGLETTPEARTKSLRALKSHVPYEQGLSAIHEIDEMTAAFKEESKNM